MSPPRHDTGEVNEAATEIQKAILFSPHPQMRVLRARDTGECPKKGRLEGRAPWPGRLISEGETGHYVASGLDPVPCPEVCRTARAKEQNAYFFIVPIE